MNLVERLREIESVLGKGESGRRLNIDGRVSEAADRIEELELELANARGLLRLARENLYSMVDPAIVAKIDEVLK